jgi:hypothetical protein
MRCLLLLLLSLSTIAEEPCPLEKQIGEDDFEIREAATQKLSELPEDKLQWLIDRHMATLKNHEVSTRFYIAAEKVFYKTTLFKRVEYRAFRATIGVDTVSCWIKQISYSSPFSGIETKSNGMECVKFINDDSPCKDFLKIGDIIESITKEDGTQAPPNETNLLAGEEIEITIRRYAEPEKAFIDGDFGYRTFDEANMDFKTSKHKIVVAWSLVYSKESDEEIRLRQWRIFLGKATIKK